MTEALREKQRREYLDEDLRANREVLNRQIAQAKMYDNEIKPPSPLEELVAWNIDKQISVLQDAIQNVIDSAIDSSSLSISNEDINKIGIAYNLLVSYIAHFARSHPMNQRDKGILDGKFLELEPLLNQLRQIVANPEAYNVDVSAQNLRVIDHIEQQIRDANYKGLSVINFKRLPVSKVPLRRGENRGYVRPQQPPPGTPRYPRPQPPSDDGNNDDEDYDNSPRPPLRARNQSALRTSDLVSSLARREGTPHSEDSASSSAPRSGLASSARLAALGLTPQDLNASLSSLKSSKAPNSAQKDSNKRPYSKSKKLAVEEPIVSTRESIKPLRLPDLEEAANTARTVHTQSQADAPSFFSSSKVASMPSLIQPTTPLHKLPAPPVLPKVEFKREYNNTAFVKNKPILDTKGQPISNTTWSLYKPLQREEAIKRTLEGSGKRRGKKYYEKQREHPLLYDSDRNDLWAKKK